jgi:amidase
MATTAGSLAMVCATPPARNAFVVKLLHRAGAVILGKTNMSEWAAMRSTYSSGGWSGRGGQTKNPYALDRNPSGSSSGSAVAVAANLCAVAVGTETDGSIVSPSSVNGVVGIKPTVGLVSRVGVIPLALSQDTVGPIARTVRDAATLLNVLAVPDPADVRVIKRPGKPVKDYTAHLKKDGLKGKCVGVARNFCGIQEGADELMEKAIQAIKAAGATVVDPANLPDTLSTQAQFFGDECQVLAYEFKADLNEYLRKRAGGKGKGPRSLEDVIKYNETHRDTEMPYFGHDLMLDAQKRGPLNDPKYLKLLRDNQKLAREDGIDKALKKGKLDLLIAPTEGPAWVTDLVNGDHIRAKAIAAASISGYPSITVPMGQVFGLPVGLLFIGPAWSEPILIEAAYAFEQATRHRKRPLFLPTARLRS